MQLTGPAGRAPHQQCLAAVSEGPARAGGERSTDCWISSPSRPRFQGSEWQPAREYRVTQQIHHGDALRVGEPVTRTVIIDAVGLEENMIVEPGWPELADARIYPTSPRESPAMTVNGRWATRNSATPWCLKKRVNWFCPSCESSGGTRAITRRRQQCCPRIRSMFSHRHWFLRPRRPCRLSPATA